MSAPAVESQTRWIPESLLGQPTSESLSTSSNNNCTRALVLLKPRQGIVQLLEERT